MEKILAKFNGNKESALTHVSEVINILTALRKDGFVDTDYRKMFDQDLDLWVSIEESLKS